MKLRSILSSLLLLWVVVLLIAPAQAVNLPGDTSFRVMKDTLAFKRSMEAFSLKLKTLECDFEQYKTVSLLKKPVSSSGHFVYREGTQVRWAYTDPFEYIIVINHGKVSILDNGKTKSFELSAHRSFFELNEKLNALINGSILSDRSDFIPEFFENDYLYKVVLHPRSKKMKGYFGELQLFFERKDLTVNRLLMKEKDGDLTDIRFSHKQINQPVSDEKFIIR